MSCSVRLPGEFLGNRLVEQLVDVTLEMTEQTLVLDKGQIVWRGESRALAADREQLAALVGLQEAASR